MPSRYKGIAARPYVDRTYLIDLILGLQIARHSLDLGQLEQARRALNSLIETAKEYGDLPPDAYQSDRNPPSK